MPNGSTTWRAHAESEATPPESYERYFVPAIGRPLAVDLVEEAGLRPGERVLDVACGTGVVARLAAERVGGPKAVAGAALREIRRVLAPGGRALISVPQPTPFFDVLDEALLRHAGEDAPRAARRRLPLAVRAQHAPDGLLTPLDGGRDALERDVVEGWSQWSDDDGMTYDQGIIVATAAWN